MSKKNGFLIFVSMAAFLVADAASAGVFEFSFGAGFNRSNFSEKSFRWSRRLSGGVAYHFNDHSGLELSIQDIRTRDKVTDDLSGIAIQDVTYKDKVYGINWIQHVLGKKYPFQPFFKVGIAQLNRDIEGTYFGASPRLQSQDSLTAVLSFGFRVFITRRIAVKTEATSYITEGGLKTWQDNVSANFGVSVFF